MRHIFKILYLAAANFLVITSASPPPVFELFDTLPTTSHPRTKEEKAFWLLEQQRHFLQDLVPFVQNPSADALPPLLITSAAITTQVHDIDLATINNTSGLLEKLAMEWMKTYLEKHDAIVKKNLVNNNTTRNISNQLMIQRRSPRARPVESSSKNNPVKVNDHTDRALNPIIHVNDLHRPEAPAEVYNTVKYHAAYSAAAYCNFGLSTWNCGARCKATQGNKIVKKLSSILTDTTGFVSVNEERESIIVTFRGTLSVRNFLTDLVITQVPFTAHGVPMEAKVHHGFYISYQTVQSDVRHYVKMLVEKYPPTFKLQFIGHSLGGALATIAAADVNAMFRDTLKDRIQVFSYGSPRVGNKEFAQYISNSFQIYRTTHKTDVVPHYPLQVFGFMHPRREHWINMEGRVVECFDEHDEDSLCSNSIGLLDFYDFISHVFGYFEFAIGPWC